MYIWYCIVNKKRRYFVKNKLIFVICAVLLISTIASNFSVSAMSNVNVGASSNDKYEVEFIENTKEYQKIKFTNKETGDVEFLEAFYSDGSSNYLSTYTDEETKQEMQVVITTENNELTIHNLTTDEETTESIIDIKEANSIQPFGLPGGYGDYVLQATFRGSKQIVDSAVGIVSVIAGIVASIFGGPVTGIVTTIAMYLASAGAVKFYYVHELYYWRDIPVYPAYFVKYYENSNYTGFIDMVWHTTVN